MIVVASLIEKVPNIAHLTRTSEVIYVNTDFRNRETSSRK